MSKGKLLIEKNLLQRLIDTFFQAKAQGKEDQYISKIQHKNPKVASAFKKMDDADIKSKLALKKALQDAGIDTSKVDTFLNTYYEKV